MLDKFFYVIDSICSQNFAAFNDPSMLMAVYVCVGIAIFIDSAFLPAAPMPCDSVVILSGTLGAMGVISFSQMLCVLISCGLLGGYVAYLQGHYLNKLKFVKKWMEVVPVETMQRVDNLIFKRGFLSLFVARFIPVVRPLTPLIIGLRTNNAFAGFSIGFQMLISSVAWIFILMCLGAIVTLFPESVRHVAMTIIIVSPVATACIGIAGGLFKYLRTKHKMDC
ncbi:DedA family protein [Photobacterium damselae]|uniref:DedA family protein n=1 Tax=Photobacterium damselae TaxID=38293 RepID=UPI001F208470|nr:VTT domain-containing protein [Photobacterium damselae]UKA04817.1 VTT domain-containing protein [Photobacterium damselae subsp. damselae]